MIQKKIMGFFIFIVLILFTVFLLFQKTQLYFYDNSPQIYIHQEYDPISNVKTDTSHHEVSYYSEIDTSKTGVYEIIYTYKNEHYSLYVEVIDNLVPEVVTKNITIDLGMNIEPLDVIESIDDDSKTNVTFLEQYTFDVTGIYQVTVVVEDSFYNKVYKEVTVTVLEEDLIAPEISGMDTMYIEKGSSVDMFMNLLIQDNQDPRPTIEVDTSSLNINKIGHYIVNYTAKDRSNNRTVAKRNVYVIEEKTIGTHYQSNDKIVYLTFDDGPSGKTKEILDILDRYNAKATFFVTAANQNYGNLIKEADSKGHTIGLHTYSHIYQTIYSSQDAFYNDLDAIGKYVESLIGRVPHYIRFPGGSSNVISKNYNEGIMTVLTKSVVEDGYQYYDWDVDSGDATASPTLEQVIKQSTSSTDTNITILLHDTGNKYVTIEALPVIIDHYQSLGYRFLGISDNSYVSKHKVNN